MKKIREQLHEAIMQKGKWFKDDYYIKASTIQDAIDKIEEPEKAENFIYNVTGFISEYYAGYDEWDDKKVIRAIKEQLDEYYEVGKETLYRIRFSDNQYAARFNEISINSILVDEDLAAHYTKQEIENIDSRLMIFAEEVTE